MISILWDLANTLTLNHWHKTSSLKLLSFHFIYFCLFSTNARANQTFLLDRRARLIRHAGHTSPRTFHPLRNHRFSPKLSSSLSAIALTFTKRVLKGSNRPSSCLFSGCCGNTSAKRRSKWSIIFSLFPHARGLALVSLSPSQFFSDALARPVRYVSANSLSVFSLSLFLSRNYDWTDTKLINSRCSHM